MIDDEYLNGNAPFLLHLEGAHRVEVLPISHYFHILRTNSPFFLGLIEQDDDFDPRKQSHPNDNLRT